MIKIIPFAGWESCIQLNNGIVDLIITTDVGPRIIRYGFLGHENELCVIDSSRGLSGGDDWRLYGGHWLWHSPEDKNKTYEPDNSPVKWDKINNGVKTIQKVEQRTGIIKEMEVSLSKSTSRVNIVHRLINKSKNPVELAVWSLTAMATGGKEVIPLKGTDTGLLPNRLLTVWPYTNLNDLRVSFGEQFIIIKQSKDMPAPFKLGTSNENGWAAYFNNNHLFIKYYKHFHKATYPDLGASYETYTNDFMLEMETLSPLTVIEPGASAEHAEQWELHDNVPVPSNDESEISTTLKDRVRKSPFA